MNGLNNLKRNKMEKKLTAVEWLETKVNGMIENGGDADLLAVIEHIQQAKATEEEQDQNKYSKEDMKLSFDAGLRKAHLSKKHSECWKEWFEQFKKQTTKG